MEQLIGNRILGSIAGDIEAMLSESAPGINEAYLNIGKGMKISIGVSFQPDPKGVEYDIKFSFAPDKVEQPEKIKASVKRVMQENQADLPLDGQLVDAFKKVYRIKEE